MTVRSAAGWCLAAALIGETAPLHAQRQTSESVAAVQQWVTAIDGHLPGHPDAAVKTITAMTYANRRHLNAGYPLFLRLLRDPDEVFGRTTLDKEVATLARTVRESTGIETFLKRAAVLHADALIFRSRFPAPPDDAPPPASPRAEKSPSGLPTVILPATLPPLLTNERVTVTRDGEIVGDLPGDWNLPFARSLLDELRRPPPPGVLSVPDAEFIAEWYHAVAAYLFANGMNGDSVSHLRHAARALPNDPRVLFDRGSYAEWFGLPIYQAVRETARSAAINLLPAEAETNAEAERLYRRALEVDPKYLEARVRLARLLDHRGRREEAAAHISAVLEARPSGVVAYYARIVAGRVAVGVGRYEDALRHYKEAAALYPGAQAALLGASQAALMLADLPMTLELVEPLGLTGADTEIDPWLDYQLGAGRDVNDLTAALWSKLKR